MEVFEWMDGWMDQGKEIVKPIMVKERENKGQNVKLQSESEITDKM